MSGLKPCKREREWASLYRCLGMGKGKQAVQVFVLMVGKMFILISECKVMFIRGSETITPSRIGLVWKTGGLSMKFALWLALLEILLGVVTEERSIRASFQILPVV